MTMRTDLRRSADPNNGYAGVQVPELGFWGFALGRLTDLCFLLLSCILCGTLDTNIG